MATTTPRPAGPPDPRPQVRERDGGHVLLGQRCRECGYAVGQPRPRCPRCRGALADVEMGPGGTVWAATVVHVPVPGLDPPYALAYVDVDEGPRVLAHAPGTQPLAIGSRVVLGAADERGNLTVVPA